MEAETLKMELGKTKTQLEFLREENQTMGKELTALRVQSFELSTDAEKVGGSRLHGCLAGVQICLGANVA